LLASTFHFLSLSGGKAIFFENLFRFHSIADEEPAGKESAQK